ncbi:MAG: PaaI family thioesterase [Spirochaetia bacterium]|nr:PaaI family thioesterase [Spirochaetia bacterium]
MEQDRNYSKFIEYFNKTDGFTKINGLRIVEMKPGYAVAEVDVTKEHLNFMGTVHGAVFFGLVDISAACAFFAYGSHCVTLSSNVSFLAAATEGKITAVAHAVSHSRRMAVMEVEISDENGRLLCRGMSTMYVSNDSKKLNEAAPDRFFG